MNHSDPQILLDRDNLGWRKIFNIHNVHALYTAEFPWY
jgi:hypothetical protein